MYKIALSALLRRLGLLERFDGLRYRVHRLRLAPRNNAFLRDHPDLAMPPPYLVYESYAMDYPAYYEDGRKTARWVIDHLDRHANLRGGGAPAPALLDWGCGPARVVRHMPEVLAGRDCAVHATDYNPRTIEWCRGHIPGVAFSLNALAPPLGYGDAAFDALYGISVLTHLSEALHRQWIPELARVLRPGGVLFLTTHGRLFRPRLTAQEREAFDAGNLVARGRVTEGHRTFTSYHPAAFMHGLFAGAGLEVTEHLEGSDQPGEFAQDIWFARKKRA